MKNRKNLIILLASLGMAKPLWGSTTPSSSLAPPKALAEDGCKNIDEKIAFQNQYRQARIDGFQLLKVGSSMRFETSTLHKGSDLEIVGEETWTVLKIHKDRLQVQFDIQSRDERGQSNQKTETKTLTAVGKGNLEKAKAEKCVFSQLYFDKFGVSKGNLAKKDITVLWRNQLNVGGAEFSEAISPNVPFGLVGEKLELTHQDKEKSSRSLRLVDFQI